MNARVIKASAKKKRPAQRQGLNFHFKDNVFVRNYQIIICKMKKGGML